MRLLLDAHVPLILAKQLQNHGVDAVALEHWRDGEFRHADDEQILAAAYEEGRSLVTYDRRTIPPILRDWAEMEQHHAGVVLISARAIRPHEVGHLLRALRALVEESGDNDWQDQIVYLRPK
jgi:predicted nuclease of predicted toxin-antitoxin system